MLLLEGQSFRLIAHHATCGICRRNLLKSPFKLRNLHLGCSKIGVPRRKSCSPASILLWYRNRTRISRLPNFNQFQNSFRACDSELGVGVLCNMVYLGEDCALLGGAGVMGLPVPSKTKSQLIGDKCLKCLTVSPELNCG